MQIQILDVEEKTLYNSPICYNCVNGTNLGGLNVTCMGPTPWKGEEVFFNNTCQKFEQE